MDDYVKTLKLLGHPARLRILSVLKRGELTVSELTTVLDMSQPRVTQYISALEQGGLVERLREGSWVFVRLRQPGDMQGDLAASILSALPQTDATLSSDLAKLADIRRARATISETFFAEVANNRGQLSHEFLPSERTEAQLLASTGHRNFDFMVDLGTGSGRMLELFSSRVSRGLGIDLSPDMLRVARHKLADPEHTHLSVQLGNIEATEIADGVADLVTLHQVLHYLDDPTLVLAEAARVLRPGGTLLIADFAEHERDAFRDDFAHRRLGFGMDEVSQWLAEQDFIVGETHRVSPAKTESLDVLIWTAQSPANQTRQQKVS